MDLSAFCSQWRDVDYISLTSIDHTLGLPTNRLLSLPELWRRRSLALESRGDLNRIVVTTALLGPVSVHCSHV